MPYGREDGRPPGGSQGGGAPLGAFGGVAIYPGDILVADGVIAVPRGMARKVAVYASQELRNDKKARRAHYEKLGWDLDETVLGD